MISLRVDSGRSCSYLTRGCHNLARFPLHRTRYDGGSFKQVTTLLESRNATNPSPSPIHPTATFAKPPPTTTMLLPNLHHPRKPTQALDLSPSKQSTRLRKPHFPSISASPFPQQFFSKHLTGWTATQTASCASAPRASSLSPIHAARQHTPH